MDGLDGFISSTPVKSSCDPRLTRYRIRSSDSDDSDCMSSTKKFKRSESDSGCVVGEHFSAEVDLTEEESNCSALDVVLAFEALSISHVSEGGNYSALDVEAAFGALSISHVSGGGHTSPPDLGHSADTGIEVSDSAESEGAAFGACSISLVSEGDHESLLDSTRSTDTGFEVSDYEPMQTHLSLGTLAVEASTDFRTAVNSYPAADDPTGLTVKLWPHQERALAWLLWRERQKPAGGILADDLGLGKTVSMISLIFKSFEEHTNSEETDSDYKSNITENISLKKSSMPRGGTLIVCDEIVCDHWKNEIKNYCGETLLVCMYDGTHPKPDICKLAKFDVVITTYNMVKDSRPKNDTQVEEKGPLCLIEWKRIILDEVQLVGHHSKPTAVSVLELTGSSRWCLTALPILQESDLYFPLKFLRCSPFDDFTKWKKCIDKKNITGRQSISTVLEGLMLSRTKEDLQANGDPQNLPAKHSVVIDVRLDPEERKLYAEVATHADNVFNQFLCQGYEKKQNRSSNLPTDQQGNQPDDNLPTAKQFAEVTGVHYVSWCHVMASLLRLRQMCCHPGLTKEMISREELRGSETTLGNGDVDLVDCMQQLKISKVVSCENPVLSFERPSTKVQAVMGLLREKVLGTTDKAVIFSQWNSVLHIVKDNLTKEEVECEMLFSDTPVAKRQAIVDDFNRSSGGPQVLLLSPAAAVGLNLVGGNHLLIVEMQLNPQQEAQAEGRILRMNQKKPVYIYKFVTVNTIEERMKVLQENKRTVADSLLTGFKCAQRLTLTKEDVKKMSDMYLSV